MGAGAPFAIAFFLWDPAHRVEIASLSVPVAFGFSMVASFTLGFFSAPMASIAQLVATQRMRSLAHAIWTMPFTLVGMGAGPLVIGTLSEAWGHGPGPDGLRSALVAATVAIPIGAAGLFVAARTLREDAETVAA